MCLVGQVGCDSMVLKRLWESNSSNAIAHSSVVNKVNWEHEASGLNWSKDGKEKHLLCPNSDKQNYMIHIDSEKW